VKQCLHDEKAPPRSGAFAINAGLSPIVASIAATWDFDGRPGHGVFDLPSQSVCEGWMLLGSVWQLETKLSIRRNRDET
jgi:hypothetical protein